MDKEYYINILSRDHCIAAQNRLFELGFLWASGEKSIQYEDSAYLFLYQHDKSFTRVGYKEYNVAGKHPVTLDGLYAPPFTGPSPITVPLNDAYSAEVSKDGISVSVDGVKQTDISYPLSVLDLLVEAKGKVGADGGMLGRRSQVVIHGKEHNQAVQNRLFELGYSWGRNDKTFNNVDAKWIYLESEMKLEFDSHSHSSPHYQYVTLDDLYGPKFTGVSEVEVKLAGPYSAKVSKDKLEVGCQSFPISVLDALLAARKEVTE